MKQGSNLRPRQDLLSDLLARIHNGSIGRLLYVDAPFFSLGWRVLHKLYERQIIAHYSLLSLTRIRIFLRVDIQGVYRFTSFRRHSLPGRRLFYSSKRVDGLMKKGQGLVLTSSGIFWFDEASSLGVGGEVLFELI